MNDIPDWAQKEAVKRLTAAHPMTTDFYRPGFHDWMVDLVASIIAAHEEAPVDPLLLEAREIAASQYEKIDDGIVRHYANPNGSYFSGTGQDIAKQYRDGKNDGNLSIALACLRRGIEIAGGVK